MHPSPVGHGSRVLVWLWSDRGATVISDTLSLVVFAVCVSTDASGFSMSVLEVQLLGIVIFIPLVLFGLSRVGALVLALVQADEGAYFVVMFAILAIAGVLADAVNLPGIVGAFLAGLSLNAAVKDKPAKEKLEVLGRSLLIPIFFIVTGFLIDPPEFLQSLKDNFGLVCRVIGTLFVGKWIAVQVAGHAFGYSPITRWTMWSLTLPQVAATLAAALVAYDTFDLDHELLIDAELLNVVLVLMLSTSIIGPVLTQLFLPRMLEEEAVGTDLDREHMISKTS